MYKAYFYLFCAFMTVIFMYLSMGTSSAETNTVSSTVVNNTPPTANAPSIINSNSDICKVGVGASVQNNIVGLASGIVIDDELCQKLKLSRSLYGFGMKVAAVSVEKNGLPVPAANITILPLSKCLIALLLI